MAGKISVDVAPSEFGSAYFYTVKVMDDDVVFTGKANGKWSIKMKVRKGKKLIKTLNSVKFKDEQ